MKHTPMLSGLMAIAALAPADAYADAKAEAQSAYQRGTAHFKAGRHAKALAAFDHAFKLDPSPVLLYNIARCHEEMGDVTQARANFELYLKRVPDAADRADVERRIRVMQAVADRSQPNAPGPGVTGRVRPKSEPPYLAYGLLGTGVVAVGIGAFLGAKASALDDDYSAEVTDAQRKRTLGDDAQTTAFSANIALAAGGALIVGGAVLWFLDAPDPAVSAFIGPQTVGIHGHF